MAISKLNEIHFGKIRGVGIVHPPITLDLKKSNRTSDYQSNGPPPKVLRSHFLSNLVRLQDITYIPWPERCGGLSYSKTWFQTFQLRWINRYLKIFIGCVLGNYGGRGGSCSPITFDYLKGDRLFQFPIERAVFEVSLTTNDHLKISFSFISGKYEV